MKVGAIGYEVHSGLGHLMRDFYRHGVVNKVLTIHHRAYPRVDGWYQPEDRFTLAQTDAFLRSIDVLLLFENAWYWEVARLAKSMAKRIALIPNYEYTPYPPNVMPDLFICASLLDMDFFLKLSPNCVFIPIPVDKPWTLRPRAINFIHNAGHGQHDFAKGTVQVIEAMKFVQSDLRLKVRLQTSERRMAELHKKIKDHPKLEVLTGDLPEESLYEDADVFLNAEQFNGMSLPLQEAYASGLLVMTSDRYPTNTWLPKEPLIPVSGYLKYKIPGAAGPTFDRASISPRSIAARIDEWYGKSIVEFSLKGRDWAQKHSWQVLGPTYLKALETLL